MKINFKKISAIGASILMTGMTMGVAAAASFPAPFVTDSGADVAIVYGTGTGVSSTDFAQSVPIISALSAAMPSSGGTAVTGGDYITLERGTTNRFNLGNALNEVYSTIDETELATVLEKATYENKNGDESVYKQKITLGSAPTLTYFLDSEFNGKVPTLGFNIPSSTHIFSYSLDFEENMAMGDLAVTTSANYLRDTSIDILGKEYYIAKAEQTTNGMKLTLLDTKDSAMLSETESSTITVNGVTHVVFITWIDADEVLLNIDGVAIDDKLEVGDVKKIPGTTDTYVSVKSILYEIKEVGVSKAEVSIGSGKIVLENNVEVKVNTKDVSDKNYDIVGSDETYSSVLTPYFTNTTKLNKLTLNWSLDDEFWLAEESELVLPGFESIKISYGGMTFDAEEVTKLGDGNSDKFVIKTEVEEGSLELPILYLNTTGTGFAGLGDGTISSGVSKELVTSSAAEDVTDPALLLNESKDSMFVATWINGDDYETYAYYLDKIEDNSGLNKTTLKSLVSGASNLVIDEVGEYEEVGNVKITLTTASDTNKTATVTLAAATGTGTVYTDRIVTKEGLQIMLPLSNQTGSLGAQNELNVVSGTTWDMNITEEDTSGKIGAGVNFTATVAIDSGDGIEITTITGDTDHPAEEGSDIRIGYVTGALATMTKKDASSDPSQVELTYHGSEAYASVVVAESSASVGGLEQLGTIVVKDSEVSQVSSKNLIVIGGSCINSVAAAKLGGAACGPAFTEKTGIKSGEYLIKSMEGYATDKIALVVAGYDAEDTQAGVSYLLNQVVDTSTANLLGTSSTSATTIAL